MILTLRGKRYILAEIGLGLVLGLLLVATMAGKGCGRESMGSEAVLPKHYPSRFTGMGHIDRIAGREIVIDDSLYRLSPAVTYNTATTNHASSAWFSAGKLVGYVTNSKGEIISLWLIE